MKINFNTIILGLTLLVLSCAKDQGNYEYSDVPRISISDEEHTGIVFVRQGEALKLSPKIELNGNVDDFSYEWFVYLNSFSASYVQDSTLVARTRDLDYVIDPNIFTLGEDYKLTYKVTNNKTNVSSFHMYQLRVSDLFTLGWIFLEEIQGKADLSMILNSGSVFHNIYSFRNPESPIQNPKSFTISAASISDAVGPDGKKYYIVGENDAIELDGTSMKKRFNYDYIFFAPPSPVKPEYIAWGGGSGNNLGLLVNNGNLHANMVGGFPGAKKFGAQMTSPSNGYNYKLAPQHLSGNGYSDTYNVMMYDELNKRFYQVTSSNLVAIDNARQDPDIFDMNNVGMDLIKLDSSNVLQIRNAIMKKDNQAFLLQFRMHVTASEPKITVGKSQILAPNIIQAADITASTLSPHLFYVAGGILYRYEVTSSTYTQEHTFAASEAVTKIKFQKHGYGNAQPRLIVCTWNGTEGKVYYFKITATGAVESLDKVHTGFGKIIDLAYKY